MIQHVRVYDVEPNLHREKRICVAAEGFSIKKVAPAADDLTCDEAEDAGVRDLEEIDFSVLAKERTADHRSDDAAVDGEAAVPYREDFRGVLRVVVPLKRHVINAGADDAEHDGEQCKVFDILRVKAAALVVGPRDQDAEQHADADNDAVKRYPEAENTDAAFQMLDADPQVGEKYVIACHEMPFFFSFFFSS